VLKFFIATLAATILLGGFLKIAGDAGWLTQTPSFAFQTLTLLFIGTVTIYGYLYKATKPQFFVQLYLLTMAVKLLAYAAYNLVMITKDKPGAVANVIFFMTAYFIFTILEIGFLYRKIRN
jgi:hypothetical protein